MHLIQLKVKPEALALSREYYDSRALPMLHRVKGILFARLIQNRNVKNELISMTLWDKKEDAEAYQDSSVFRQFMAEYTPYLAESSEWKVQLSEKGEIEYKPAAEEPVIQSFPVSTQKDLKSPLPAPSPKMCARVVSIKLHKGKLGEFRTLYKEKIIPALEKTKGCLYAYLMDNLGEGEAIISVTIWDSREAAEEYEKSGKFDYLIDKVKHTFSRLYQWKMSLSKESGQEAKTSDDLKVDHYKIVSGQEF